MATYKGHRNRDDNFVGTNGADTFTFRTRDFNSGDSVSGGGGLDTLIFTGRGSVNLDNVYDVESIRLSDEGMSVTFQSVFGNSGRTVVGGDGDDQIRIGASAFQSSMNGAASLTINGGDGFDTFGYANNGSSTAAALTIDLGARDDQSTLPGLVLRNIEGLDFTGYNERISATGSAADNVLAGSFYSDVLSGGAGDDILDGGDTQLDYRDTLTGGQGEDTFRFSYRRDDSTPFFNIGANVTDFDPSQDRLQFDRSEFGISGRAFDRAEVVTSTGTSITGLDVIYYDGILTGSDAVKEYLSDARGGSVGQGVFVMALDSAHHTVLYHALDASFTQSSSVAVVADLGDIGKPTDIPLTDFSFI